MLFSFRRSALSLPHYAIDTFSRPLWPAIFTLFKPIWGKFSHTSNYRRNRKIWRRKTYLFEKVNFGSNVLSQIELLWPLHKIFYDWNLVTGLFLGANFLCVPWRSIHDLELQHLCWMWLGGIFHCSTMKLQTLGWTDDHSSWELEWATHICWEQTTSKARQFILELESDKIN